MKNFFQKLISHDFIKKNWKYMISLFIMLLLIAATFYVLLGQMDFKTFCSYLKKCDWRYLLGALILVFLFIYSEGAATRVAVSALGQKISYRAGFVYASIDIYFSYITPSATGGQPLMMYYMAKDKIHVSKSGIVILMYTSFYSIALVLLGIWAFIFYHPYLFTLKKSFLVLYFAGMGLCIILTVFCLLAMFSQKWIKKAGVWLLSFLSRVSIVKNKDRKIKNFLIQLREYEQGARFIRTHPFVSLRVFFWVLVQRISMLSIVYFVYRSFGLEGNSYFELFALQTFWTVASYAIPIPGAVGISEGMFLVLFSAVFGPELLMPGLFLSRGINFYLSLVVCATVTIINQFRLVRIEKKRLNEKTH